MPAPPPERPQPHPAEHDSFGRSSFPQAPNQTHELKSAATLHAAPACYLCKSRATRLVEANPGYSYVACSSCGFRRLHPLHTEEEEAHLYEEDYYSDRGLESDLDHQPVLMQELIAGRVRELTRLNGGPGRLLDVGAGTGLFAEAACRAGWQAEGIEPSESAVRLARSITRARIEQRRLEDTTAGAGFDAVTFWDVLEHVADPRATLEVAARRLRPRGLVGLSLPNVGGGKARLSGHRWRYYQRSFGHISHFSPRTIRLLLEQSGFLIERVDTRGLVNLGRPFGLDPVAVRAGHPWLSALQAAADRSAGYAGLGESLVAYGRLVAA